MPRLVLWIAVLAALLPAGCRAVSVESDPRPRTAIDVRNETASPLLVYYDAGAGARLLGAVAANAVEPFIITVAPGTTVHVTGRTEDGARVYGPFAVTLQAGTTPRVVLR